MKRTKNLKKERGITLIALVVTIVVLLILAGISINAVLGNNGLIVKAKDAKEQTEQDQVNTEMAMNNLYDEMENAINGTGNENIDGEVFSEIYEENTEITQDNYTAVIPKGFSVGESDGINSIAEGLVIQDAKGNQFVWIPVNYTATGEVDENGLDAGLLAVFDQNDMYYEYSEPYENGYTNSDGTTESEDYYEMMLSVQENKGFYIGRFEAGTLNPRNYGEENGTDTMVVKRDAYPYNMVAWGRDMNDYESVIKYDFDNWVYDENTGLDQGHGAVYLSKHLLDGQNTGAKSTLCYDVQWDAMADFLGDDMDIYNSKNYGNYRDSEFTLTRTTAKYSRLSSITWAFEEWTSVPTEGINKVYGEGLLLTTGASDNFKAKNIFDVAGNTEEWIMSAYSSNCRADRGGWYYQIANNNSSVYYRGYSDPFICYDFVSFRPTLYICD